jgi:hypothetical protein
LPHALALRVQHLVVAPPLLHERLLLALLSRALGDLALLRVAPGLGQFLARLFIAPCLVLPARLLFALSSLFAQGLRISVGRAACLLDELGMRFAALLLLALGDHGLAPGLFGALGDGLFALGLLLAAGLFLVPRLLRALGEQLLAPGLLGPARFLAARALGQFHGLFAALARFGLLRFAGQRQLRGLVLALCLVLAAGLFGTRGLHAALLLLLGRLLLRATLRIGVGQRRARNGNRGCRRHGAWWHGRCRDLRFCLNLSWRPCCGCC